MQSKQIDRIQAVFRDKFPDTGRVKGVFSAPGRVNLIGEHTDYNEGFVLPMAIEREIIMAAQLREDQLVRVYSLDYDTLISFPLEELDYDRENGWVNYLKGVIQELLKLDYQLQGFNLAFTGNIPRGAGLSSSAALEVAAAVSLTALNGIELGGVEMALLCQRAENKFVGVNCGIMDQYISRLGQRDSALMIDCRSKEYELIPFRQQDLRVVICDSRVERGLVDSEYNQRREECRRAVDFFKSRVDHRVEALRDLSVADFNEYGEGLPATVYRRARHVITENSRVLTAAAALKNGDFITTGQLMNESHQSLRDDFAVSCPELDLLVELAREQAAVLGARMTGAGFGGSTVNLVKGNQLDSFIQAVKSGYQAETGIEPGIYSTAAAPGAGVISLEQPEDSTEDSTIN